jgi:hypothetical protein
MATEKKPASKKKLPAAKTVKKKPGPTRKAPPEKTDAPRKAAVPKKAATAKRVAPRGLLNPQQQFAKLSPEPSRSRGPAERESAGAAMPEAFFSTYTGAALTEQDFAAAAQNLGCEVAAAKAVAEVETAGASFDANRRPTILYERHIFARNTVPKGKFNQSHPNLSANTGYGKGGYGTKDEQYARLAGAYQLDPDAALKAASWGKFQILGENHQACGFASVGDFVKAMTVSEVEHVKAFVRFVQSSPKLVNALRNKDWASFARLYNGPGYKTFSYDTKLAAAYVKQAGR